MAEGQLVTPLAGDASADASRWRSVIERCARDAGPFDPSLLASWRREMDGVAARLAALRREAPVVAVAADPLPAGVHALLAIAGARLGSVWRPEQLVDAATAMELARHAVLQHAAVRDRDVDGRGGTPGDGATAGDGATGGDASCGERPIEVAPLNKLHVLHGDWSITQAARLVADIGPAAYRVLVRGWGAAQLIRLRTGQAAAAGVLFDTAISLGALTAGVALDAARAMPQQACATTQVRDWAVRL